MLPRMDPSVSPCTDLYQYSCGGHTKAFPKPPPTRARWGPKEEMKAQHAKAVRDIIATLPHPTKTHSITWKIKYFYDSCMALDNIETDNKRPLKRIINELGGWNVLREFSVLAWDFSQALVRLQAEYGVSSFFKVSVIPHPGNSNRSVIELSPSPLGLAHPSYYRSNEDKIVRSYKHFMKDVVQLLGATSTDAKTFSEDMFYFERRIAEILPPPSELADFRRHQLINVTHLKAVAPSVPILEVLNALLPSANVGENTQILVRSLRYMTSISTIIATTDRSALNNYVMWQLASMYLPYLSQDLQDIHFVYLRDTTGVSEPLERWEVCVNTLLKYQSLGVATRLEKSVSEVARAQKKAAVKTMANILIDTVKESVTKAKWIELEYYNHIVNKLENLKLYVGLPNNLLDDVYLEEYYSKLFVQKNDFFQNIRYGVSFLQEEMQRRFLSPRPEYTWLPLMGQLRVRYVTSINALIIPDNQLQEPFFHTDYLPGIVYGSLGVDIAKQIVAGVLPPLGLYAANGSRVEANSLIANLSQTSLQSQLSCLSLDETSQNLDLFYTVSAVRQALRGLSKALKEVDHVHQPGLEELEDSSQLLLRFAQEQCTVQTAQDAAVEKVTNQPLHGHNLLTAVRENLKHLADAFGCSLPSSACRHFL